MDFLKKKPSKAEIENEAKLEEERKLFIQEIDEVQKKHNKALAVIFQYTESGITPAFKVVPYPTEQAKTDLVK